MKQCYFKKIVDSDSKEAEQFLKQFSIDYKRCKFKCSGYLGYGSCENYKTQEDVDEGGLSKLIRVDITTNERR